LPSPCGKDGVQSTQSEGQMTRGSVSGDTIPFLPSSDVLIVPNGMGHMDWVRDSWHQSRIVPPRRDLRRLASVQAVTRLSRLYLPGGTIRFFPPLKYSRGNVSMISARRSG